MIFYKIHIDSLPEICFAHSICKMYSDENMNIIDHRAGMIELDYQENHFVKVTADSGIYMIRENSIGLFMPDQRYELTFPHKEKVECITSTIGVRILMFPFERFDLTETEALEQIESSDSKTLFIPQVTTLSEEDAVLYQAKYKSIIDHFARADNVSEQLYALAGWMELLAWLNEKFRRMIMGKEAKSKTSMYYVVKARKYMEKHYREGISLRHVAEALGVSTVYLSSLFKKETGVTVVQYINTLRVQCIRDLLLEEGMNLSELCRSVGLHDCRYAQKLFKKYYGVSMRQFRLLGHGITLHFDNPYMKTHLDHDIYEEPSAPESDEF